MIENHITGVVIPCYMGGETSLKVVLDVLNYADLVVFVDDFCPKNTGNLIKKKINSSKLHFIFNTSNLGVGASTKKGFLWLLDQGADIIIKVYADGQIEASDIPRMCLPIIKNECQSTKANRFNNIDTVFKMPTVRLIGNIGLSFITKLSTGYWELLDPTNGLIAFNSNTLKKIDLFKTDNRFFFETDLLFRCALKNINIKNIPIDPIYNNNYSSLKPLEQLPIFLVKHIKLIIKRIFYQYYLLDFNPGSIELFLSILMGLISLFIAFLSIYKSHVTGVLTSAGTASIFTISAIMSIQLFISFIYYDCTIRIIFRERNN